MRRRAGLLAASALLAAAAGGTPAPAAAPNRVLVTADEWSLVLSRPAVRRTPLILQLRNAGEDAHDLVLRRVDRRGRGTGRAVQVPEVRPGEVAQRTVRLRAGRWRLWCSLPGHRAAGMRATLRVR